MAKYHYVYRITHIIKNMYYYGSRTSTISPELDIGINYFSSSGSTRFGGGAEWIEDQKLNPQNYKYKVIRIFKTREEATSFEIKLHRKFDVKLHESFYNASNQTSTGFDTTGLITVRKGKTFSDEHRLNLSIAHKGNIITEETKKKISESQKGKFVSKETKRKISEAKLGIPRSEETREKLRKANIGKKLSEETKRKISEGNKGHCRKHNEETKRKISAACKGIKLSEETKKKMSKPQPKIKCPWCDKTGGNKAMKRYHFERCKNK